jgi:hypothetical protein
MHSHPGPTSAVRSAIRVQGESDMTVEDWPLDSDPAARLAQWWPAPHLVAQSLPAPAGPRSAKGHLEWHRSGD